MLLFNRLSKKQDVRRFLCWVLIGILVIPLALVRQTQAQTVTTPPLSQEMTNSTKIRNKEELKRLADQMEKMFGALEAATKEIPRDTFDPNAIVKKVGNDPVKLFEWVRDNTYLVPYRGVLRDHMGVLMDRLGNSLDRALLLGKLLSQAGFNVRLVNAELSLAEAEAVLEKVRMIPERGDVPMQTQPPHLTTKEMAGKYAERYQLDAEELHRVLNSQILKAQRLAEEAVQRVAQQTAVIADAVGIPNRKKQEELREQRRIAARIALQDHWWIQWQNGSEWLDLDPTLPSSEIGKPLPRTTLKIVPLFDEEGSGSLDSKFYHEIHIRIVIEQWKKGRLEQKPVLNHTLRPSELIGQNIVLRHYPAEWPQDLNLVNEKDFLNLLKSTILAQDEWLPILTVGSEDFSESSFTDSGDLAVSPLGRISIAAGIAKGLKKFNPFEAAKRAANLTAKPKSNGILTAEWIEYEIRIPGQKEPRKIRREVFDILGPATRSANRGAVQAPKITKSQQLDRGLALLGEFEILPLTCHLSNTFVEYLFATSLLANQKLFLGLLQRGILLDPRDLGKELSTLIPMPGALYNLALARREWSRVRRGIYLDRTNVLAYRKFPRLDEEGNILLCHGFDIITNDIAIQKETNANSFLVRLEQGVLDTNTEALLMPNCGEVVNTAELFAKSINQGVEWITIRNIDDPAWERVDLPPNVRTRIEQELADYVIVVPKRPLILEGRAVVSWWRVNPVTGQTLGMGETGGGSSEEYAHMIHAIKEVTVWFVMFGICMGINFYNYGYEIPVDAAMVCVMSWFAIEVPVGMLTGSIIAGALCGFIIELLHHGLADH